MRPTDDTPIGTAEATPNGIINHREHVIEAAEANGTYAERLPSKRVLSEREQMMVRLLTGYKMSRSEIAEAMGESMVRLNQYLNKLVDEGVIMSEGPKKLRRFYTSSNTDTDGRRGNVSLLG